MRAVWARGPARRPACRAMHASRASLAPHTATRAGFSPVCTVMAVSAATHTAAAARSSAKRVWRAIATLV